MTRKLFRNTLTHPMLKSNATYSKILFNKLLCEDNSKRTFTLASKVVPTSQFDVKSNT